MLESKDAEAADEGDVAEETIEGDELEDADTGHDGLCGGKAEIARQTRPSKGAKHTGECGDDVDESEGCGCHGELCLGEEYSGAGNGGDPVREKKPGCKEEDDILEMAGTENRFVERVPGVADIGWPRAAFVGAGERGARPRSEVERCRYGEDEPPEADEEQDESERESRLASE